MEVPVLDWIEIPVPLTQTNDLHVNLVELWVNLWCNTNCKSQWQVQRIARPYDSILAVRFSNSREAVTFKLIADTFS